MNTRSTNRVARIVELERLRRAFTLLEILVVVVIIALLIGILGTTVTTSIRKAREAATVALIQKIEGLLDDRRKGFERAVKSRDFERIVQLRKQSLEAGGIFGVSPRVIESIARKEFYRQLFPQRFEDLGVDGEDKNLNGILDPGEDNNGNSTLDGANGVPDVLEKVTGVVVAALQAQGPSISTNPVSATAVRHETESSELLYFMLTQMQVFGVPPVGESEFRVGNEVRDTDGDGLLEFVDGWGRPLRFYRWPTRLIKPNGPYGGDGMPGTGGATVAAYGTLGTDDVAIALAPTNMRPIAALLMEALPPAPAFPLGQWDPLSEDPDDPYGLISTEIKRLFTFGIDVTGTYTELLYPTLDTYHTPLIISCGADGELGLYEPFASGPGMTNMGILAQPIHNPSGTAYDFGPLAVTPNGKHVLAALSDNMTNRNRRAGKGK